MTFHISRGWTPFMILGLVAFAAGAGYHVVFGDVESSFVSLSPSSSVAPTFSPGQSPASATPTPTPKPSPTPTKAPTTGLILLDVPFTSQAPFREWSDPRQQDACEEASVLMAVYWARGKSLNPQLAKDEILAMSAYEQETYGSYHDTSAADTVKRLFNEYYNYTNVRVQYSVTTQDIIDELQNGNVIIVPANGQILANPHYTPPGPVRHMLAIIGYDPSTKEFITNDVGIGSGKGWRYKETVVGKSLQDYETGHHEPFVEFRTAMIVVSK